MNMKYRTDDKPKTVREPTPAGVHGSRCKAIIDLGTRMETYMDESKSRHKVWIQWEHPSLRVQVDVDGEMKDLPRASSAFYTLSFYEKANLCKMLTSWRGEEFTQDDAGEWSLKSMLAEPCMLQVVHKTSKGVVKDKIDNVMALPDGMVVAELESDPIWFSLEEGTEIPESVPKGIAKMIMQSDEYKAANGDAPDADAPDFAKMSAEKATEVEGEDLPF